MNLIIALILLALSPGPADTCPCETYRDPVCAAYWQGAAVFVGQVRDITTTQSNTVVRLEMNVEQAYRGISSATVTILAGTAPSCGRQYVTGERYLIYAFRPGDSRQLWTGSCANKKLADATEDLNYLRSLMQGGITESISGKFIDDGEKPVSDVKIEVKKGAETFTTKPNAEGEYSLALNGAGTYRVFVSIPRSVNVTSNRRELDNEIETTDALTTLQFSLELQKGQCDYREFEVEAVDLHATGSVSGVVLTASGRPLNKGSIYLERMSDPKILISTKLPKDGKFSFGRLSVGEYYVVVNYDNEAPRDDDAPYPRTYYPSASHIESATKIVITEGANLEGLILRLGPPLKERTVSGRVIRENGEVAPKTKVSLYRGDQWIRVVETDDNGMFSIKMYGEFDYELRASESARVKLTAKTSNIMLVLKPEW